MKKTLVSVVLGTYNRLNFLKLAIESVREELKDFSHEIIVVDGGSNDGTLKWLAKQKDILTIIQHNRGFWLDKKIERRSWGYFMNLGFKCAQGKYVCMISDDCLVIPGAIVNGCNLFEKELSVDKKIGSAAFYWRNWQMHEKYFVMKTLGDTLYANHGLFLNEALQEVGYFDEQTYQFYNGDCDLGLKLAYAGYKCIVSENSYIEHYQHANLKVRKSNECLSDHDGPAFLKKWKGLFFDDENNLGGGIVEKEFNDPTKTGEKFRYMQFLHVDVIGFKLFQSSKQLLKKVVFRSKS